MGGIVDCVGHVEYKETAALHMKVLNSSVKVWSFTRILDRTIDSIIYNTVATVLDMKPINPKI